MGETIASAVRVAAAVRIFPLPCSPRSPPPPPPPLRPLPSVPPTHCLAHKLNKPTPMTHEGQRGGVRGGRGTTRGVGGNAGHWWLWAAQSSMALLLSAAQGSMALLSSSYMGPVAGTAADTVGRKQDGRTATVSPGGPPAGQPVSGGRTATAPQRQNNNTWSSTWRTPLPRVRSRRVPHGTALSVTRTRKRKRCTPTSGDGGHRRLSTSPRHHRL